MSGAPSGMDAGLRVSTSRDLTRGVLWALAAGIFWGGAFVAPVVLEGYAALDITTGRFVGSGVFSLLVLAAARARGPVAGLADPHIWRASLGLAVLGSFVYYLFMVAGVQRANAAIVTLIVGMLPVAIPLVADVRAGTFSLAKTALPCMLMAAGLFAVHHGAHGALSGGRLDFTYFSGIICALIAFASWLIYALRNTETIRRHPEVSAATWSSLQNVSLLPLALPALVLSLALQVPDAASLANRPSLPVFLLVSMALGILTSWVAMWAWNRASQLLPTSLAGQLLVFETLASLTFVYLWKASLPPRLVVAGAALLIGGVVLGIRRLTAGETP